MILAQATNLLKATLIDSDAIEIFSNNINTRFPDYAEVSGYNHLKTVLRLHEKFKRTRW